MALTKQKPSNNQNIKLNGHNWQKENQIFWGYFLMFMLESIPT